MAERVRAAIFLAACSALAAGFPLLALAICVGWLVIDF